MLTHNCSNHIKKVIELAKDDDVDLWALDEVHFQQHGSRCRMWVPPEERDPVVLHHPGRQSIGYFGAIRIRDGKFFYRREESKFNADSFFRFMKDLKKITSKHKKTILIIDNAKYHHANLHKDWREDNDDKIHFDFLPPYSPDLNPIERVWKLTRRLCLHNRYFPSMKAIIGAVEYQFDLWKIANDTLKRLCAII